MRGVDGAPQLLVCCFDMVMCVNRSGRSTAALGEARARPRQPWPPPAAPPAPSRWVSQPTHYPVPTNQPTYIHSLVHSLLVFLLPCPINLCNHRTVNHFSHSSHRSIYLSCFWGYYFVLRSSIMHNCSIVFFSVAFHCILWKNYVQRWLQFLAN